MDILSATRTVLAKAYITDGVEAEDYWYEGDPVEVQIERTDNDEIRVGIHISGSQTEAAGIYLSRSEAIRLILAVAASCGDR